MSELTHAPAQLSRVRHHFFVCTNRRPANHSLPSCAPRGAEDIYAAFLCEVARRGYPPGVKVTATSCLTPCQHGPNVVVYPAGIWYAGVMQEDVKEIITAHVDHGTTIERLRLPDEVRV